MSPPATLLSAVPVPFETNGDLDEKGQKTLLRHLEGIGVPGVFVSGTTGSSPRWTTTNEPRC
jgi:dihydrodipicolinate synthase/N-acetylneuraminate lyase